MILKVASSGVECEDFRRLFRDLPTTFASVGVQNKPTGKPWSYLRGFVPFVTSDRRGFSLGAATIVVRRLC